MGYLKLSNFKQAEGYLFHSAKIAQFIYKRDDHPSIIRVNHNLGVLYTYFSEFEKASKYLESNYLLFEKIYGKFYKTRPEYNALLKDHANLLANQGNISAAKMKYLKALNIAKKIYGANENNPNPKLIELWINLMVVDRENLENEYATKLINLLSSKNIKLDLYLRFIILMNLGGYYIKMCDIEEPQYWKQALELGKNVFREHVEGLSLINNATIARAIDINECKKIVNVLKGVYEFDTNNPSSAFIVSSINSMMQKGNMDFNNQHTNTIKALINGQMYKLDDNQKFCIILNLISFYIEMRIVINHYQLRADSLMIAAKAA